jgi:cell division protein FtsB
VINKDNNYKKGLTYINKKTLKEKIKRANKKKAYYLFITFLLLICLFQALRGVYLNATKYIALNQQLNKLEKLNVVALEKNKELQKQIQNYASVKGIEGLARDNLKMVGKDEVLVIIKDSPTTNSKR